MRSPNGWGNVMVGLRAQHESIRVDVAASFDCPANEPSPKRCSSADRFEQRLTGDHIPPSTPCPLRGRVVASSSPEEVAFTPIVPDDRVSASRCYSRHRFAPAWV